jgi:hypothetical protein
MLLLCNRQLRTEQDRWSAVLILYSLQEARRQAGADSHETRVATDRFEASSFSFRWHGVYYNEYSHYESSEERGVINTSDRD